MTAGKMQDVSLGMQITNLLGSDDWLILHDGHHMVTALELDDLELKVEAPTDYCRIPYAYGQTWKSDGNGHCANCGARQVDHA